MKYVAYYRVSTKGQETSHLSLDAQRETVLQYIKHNGNQVIAEFTEVESGKNDKRPELLKALFLCKQEQATLVIAKLDRLSRNNTFISTLMDNKVPFICCDMPDATELTIHIFAAIAQWERKRISERTKEGLRAKRLKEPNYKHGGGTFTDEGRAKSYAKLKRNADSNKESRQAFHFIKPLMEKGVSLRKIADMLNAEDYHTRTGKRFYAQQVKNIWKRFSKEE